MFNKILIIVCVSLMIICLVFTAQSSAEIDPETIVGLWLFDEDKGDVAKDSSGNGNDGTLKNEPKWVDGEWIDDLWIVDCRLLIVD